MFYDDGFQPLTEIECHDLLAQTRIGRLSLSLRALPVVVPVTYGYLGGNVVIGMGDGPARRAIAGGSVIALGVDNAHLTDPFWSVVVVGRAREIIDSTQATEFQRLGLADLTGTRPEHYLRLQPDLMTGYRATQPANN